MRGVPPSLAPILPITFHNHLIEGAIVHDMWVEQELLKAFECLRRIAAREDTLVNASQALGAVLAASTAQPNLAGFSPRLTSKVSHAVGRARPVLVDAISTDLSMLDVEFAFTALDDLLSHPTADVSTQQIRVGLLSAELSALHYRRKLAKRGGVTSVSVFFPASSSVQ